MIEVPSRRAAGPSRTIRVALGVAGRGEANPSKAGSSLNAGIDTRTSPRPLSGDSSFAPFRALASRAASGVMFGPRTEVAATRLPVC